MSGADWSQPQLTTAYATFLADLAARLNDAITLFQNAGLGSNLPAYTIRFNAANARFEVTPGGGTSPTDWRGLACYSPWNDFGTASYVAANQFSVAGNQTALFAVGRRVQCLDSSTLYGTVTAAAYSGGSGLTTVTVVLDAGALSIHLSDVLTAEIDPAGTAVPTLPARAMAWDSQVVAVSGTSFPSWIPGALYDCSNTSAASGTIPASSGSAIAATAGYALSFKNSGVSIVTLTAPTASAATDTIDGQATLTLYPGDIAELYVAGVGLWRNRSTQRARPSLPPVARSGSATLTAADFGTEQRVGATATLTLMQTGSTSGKAAAGVQIAFLVAAGATTLTIARAGSDTIAGATSLTLSTQWTGVVLQSDGNGHWDIVGLMGSGALGNAAAKSVTDNTQAIVASTSGSFTQGDVLVAGDSSGTVADGGGSPFAFAIPAALALGR